MGQWLFMVLVISLLKKVKPKGIIISGEKHPDKSYDIDLYCMLNGYRLKLFNPSYPLNHGPTRVYQISETKIGFINKFFCKFVQLLGYFFPKIKKKILYIYFTLLDPILKM